MSSTNSEGTLTGKTDDGITWTYTGGSAWVTDTRIPAGLDCLPAGLKCHPAGLDCHPAGLKCLPAGLKCRPAGLD